MANQNPDLLKQAEELSITVNARWSDETLQKKIDEALAGSGSGSGSGQKPDTDEEGAATPPGPAGTGEQFGGKGDHDGNGTTGGAAPAVSGKEYTLRADYWPTADERIAAGTVIVLDDKEALRLGPNVLAPKGIF